MQASVRTSTSIEFHSPTPEDAAWARPILLAANRMGCEFCFGNIYAWSQKYRTEITQMEGCFVARSGWGAYSFPVGPGDLRALLPALREDAARQGKPLKFYGLNQGDIERLEQAAPGVFRYAANRDDCDYIYRRADLAALAGKKYHQKRNHAARFMRENNWRCEEISPAALDECLDMCRRWAEANSDRNPEGIRQELVALERSLAHFEAFGLRGCLLRAGGKAVAFTLGEALNERCFCTHFEKADANYAGAYQMINRCFAEHLTGYELINREEDLGDDGLRRAKLSYYPEILLEKSTAVEK